ncbi:MAG: hypothetical protein K6G92_07545 [Bacteroidaceae bacterium]|nr:hypothetical protein [Bacteroidaceae bacterium]
MEFLETSNPIYNEFFVNSDLDAKVERTKWRGQDSNNSFCFINPKVKYKHYQNEVLIKLKEVFGIKSSSFDKKFEMAISGDGQEVKRISTLHSSTLAALLLLYSVKDKTLTCKLDEEEFTFNDCFYEVKTNVKDSHFSNMDVVLVGKNSRKKDVIFFLESKFSEYLNTGMCNNISKEAYEKIYDELGLTNVDGTISGLCFKENEGYLQIKSSDPQTPQYCSGIKQMISHYIGVTNFINKGAKAMDSKQKLCFNELVNLLNNGAEVILGEVLFDFDNKVDNAATKLLKYSSIYKDLATLLNAKKDKPSNLHVLAEVLTYQELLKGFKIDRKVKDFYQL